MSSEEREVRKNLQDPSKVRRARDRLARRMVDAGVDRKLAREQAERTTRKVLRDRGVE